MAALSLSQRLTIRSISSAGKLLEPPNPGVDLPGYIVGWDKTTGAPIVKRNGALITIKPTYNKGIGLRRSIAVSATFGAF
jgi:hypothetical protein